MSSNEKIADALEQCKWENVPIGNKAIIMAAINALRAAWLRQPHGEPVALPESKLINAAVQDKTLAYCRGWNACLDEIAKLGPLYARPAQGEPAAWLVDTGRGKSAYVNDPRHWAHGYKVIPLYAHADPTEVERLRERCAERDAKACAMLELAVEALKDLDHKSDWVEGVQADIERYLSASAELSAPIKMKPLGQRVAQILAENAEGLMLKASAPKFGVLAGKSEILGERCADGGKCHHACKTECFRKDCCVPLSGSGLTDDWKEP